MLPPRTHSVQIAACRNDERGPVRWRARCPSAHMTSTRAGRMLDVVSTHRASSRAPCPRWRGRRRTHRMGPLAAYQRRPLLGSRAHSSRLARSSQARHQRRPLRNGAPDIRSQGAATLRWTPSRTADLPGRRERPSGGTDLRRAHQKGIDFPPQRIASGRPRTRGRPLAPEWPAASWAPRAATGDDGTPPACETWRSTDPSILSSPRRRCLFPA